MALHISKYAAHMEDGTVHEVEADQRDAMAFSLHSGGLAALDYQVYFTRFTAWNALNRTGKLKITWEKFNKECIQVMLADVDDKSKSTVD